MFQIKALGKRKHIVFVAILCLIGLCGGPFATKMQQRFAPSMVSELAALPGESAQIAVVVSIFSFENSHWLSLGERPKALFRASRIWPERLTCNYTADMNEGVGSLSKE